MGQIRHTTRAREDMISIWVNIAQKNPAAADRIFDRLEERVLVLARYPEVGLPGSTSPAMQECS